MVFTLKGDEIDPQLTRVPLGMDEVPSRLFSRDFG